jgi:predicted PurR-regulated permease PerM
MLSSTSSEADDQISQRLLNVLIRAGLLFALVWVCVAIFAPFLSLMLWALILAVNLFPTQQGLASRLGGRQGTAAVLLVLAGIALFVVPTGYLMNLLGDSVSGLIEGVRSNSLKIPEPAASVADWPVIGKKVYSIWKQSATDLPGFVQSLQPKIGNVARQAVELVASMGGALLQFMASLLIAGIMMSYGQSGHSTVQAIARRIAGNDRGDHFTSLCTATIRAVARGVIGIAFVQALLLGIALHIAQVPAAGFLALVTLVFGIAQAPAALITIPAILYVWSAGGHSTGLDITYTVMLLAAGSADNILKPLLLGRGVDAPMPVVLMGALGGMVSSGILGLFVGATLLTLGYQIFMDWVAHTDLEPPVPGGKTASPPQTEGDPVPAP